MFIHAIKLFTPLLAVSKLDTVVKLKQTNVHANITKSRKNTVALNIGRYSPIAMKMALRITSERHHSHIL